MDTKIGPASRKRKFPTALFSTINSSSNNNNNNITITDANNSDNRTVKTPRKASTSLRRRIFGHNGNADIIKDDNFDELSSATSDYEQSIFASSSPAKKPGINNAQQTNRLRKLALMLNRPHIDNNISSSSNNQSFNTNDDSGDSARTTAYANEAELSDCLAFSINDPKFSDITIVIGAPSDSPRGVTTTFYAHKLILSRRSSYFFERLYLSNNTVSDIEAPPSITAVSSSASFNSPRLSNSEVIYLPHVAPTTFFKVLQYMYAAKIRLHSSDVLDILDLAYDLGIPSLVQICLSHLQQYIHRETCFSLFEVGRLYGGDDIMDACIEFIRKNTQDVCRTSYDLRNISEESLIAIIDRCHEAGLDASNEVDIFHGLVRWARFRVMDDNGIPVSPRQEDSTTIITNTNNGERAEEGEDHNNTFFFVERMKEVAANGLEHIQFERMTSTQLSTIVEPSQLVSTDVLLRLYKRLASANAAAAAASSSSSSNHRHPRSPAKGSPVRSPSRRSAAKGSPIASPSGRMARATPKGPHLQHLKSAANVFDSGTSPRRACKFNNNNNNNENTPTTELKRSNTFTILKTYPVSIVNNNNSSSSSSNNPNGTRAQEHNNSSSSSNNNNNSASVEIDFSDVDMFIHDHEACSFFRQYCLQEYSTENLDFILDVAQFKALAQEASTSPYTSLDTLFQLRELAQDIFDTFIRERAPNEVNIERSLREQVQKRLQVATKPSEVATTATATATATAAAATTTTTTSTITRGDCMNDNDNIDDIIDDTVQRMAVREDWFDEVEKAVKINLRDTFLRFQKTDLYSEFKRLMLAKRHREMDNRQREVVIVAPEATTTTTTTATPYVSNDDDDTDDDDILLHNQSMESVVEYNCNDAVL